MIAFNELRIGNYVLVHSSIQKVATISGINDEAHLPSVGYYIGEELHYIDCSSKDLQSVLLNDGLLEKSGFFYDGYFQLWQKPRPVTGTGMEMELDRDFNVVDFMRRPLLKEVQSIHRLQNLYYALMGKELSLTSMQALTN